MAKRKSKNSEKTRRQVTPVVHKPVPPEVAKIVEHGACVLCKWSYYGTECRLRPPDSGGFGKTKLRDWCAEFDWNGTAPILAGTLGDLGISVRACGVLESREGCDWTVVWLINQGRWSISRIKGIGKKTMKILNAALKGLW